jgi:L,D-transpeptidase catalytic domain
MKKIKYLFIMATITLLGATWPFSWLFDAPNPEAQGTSRWLEREIQIIKSQAGNIDNKVLRMSLNAYVKARKKGFDQKQLLTVIDYSKPSTEKRFQYPWQLKI